MCYYSHTPHKHTLTNHDTLVQKLHKENSLAYMVALCFSSVMMLWWYGPVAHQSFAIYFYFHFILLMSNITIRELSDFLSKKYFGEIPRFTREWEKCIAYLERAYRLCGYVVNNIVQSDIQENYFIVEFGFQKHVCFYNKFTIKTLIDGFHFIVVCRRACAETQNSRPTHTSSLMMQLPTQVGYIHSRKNCFKANIRVYKSSVDFYILFNLKIFKNTILFIECDAMVKLRCKDPYIYHKDVTYNAEDEIFFE